MTFDNHRQSANSQSAKAARLSFASPPLPPDPPPLPELSKGATFLERFFQGSARQQAPAPSSKNALAGELRSQLLYTSSNKTNDALTTSGFSHVASQSASHKTGLVIRALDINQSRTHVVLAGSKILKTVKVHDRDESSAGCVEDVNIRSATINYPSSKDNSKSSTRESTSNVASIQRETFDIEDVAWSNGSYANHIATAASNGKIMLYDLVKPGIEVGRLHEHSRQVHKVDFNPLEGQSLLSGSQDGTVRLWDLRSSRPNVMNCSSQDTYEGRSNGVRHTKWSPVHTWSFALGTDNGNVQRWDVRNTKAPVLRLPAHVGSCNSVDWHPDGKHLASAGRDQNVKVWNLNGKRGQDPVFQLRAPMEVQNVRWRPPCYVGSHAPDQLIKQCTHLATSYTTDPVVHIWDLRRPCMPFRLLHHQVNNSTKDMLWRTKDLLWTVGPEGEFCQSDVRYLPKTIDWRPMQAHDWTSSNEMILFAQKRPSKRMSYYDPDSHSDDRAAGVEPKNDEIKFGSQGHGDDSLEENFLSSSAPKKYLRGSSYMSSKSLGSTPPSYEDYARPVKLLDETMRNNDAIAMTQPARVGSLPELATGGVYAYFVRKLMAAHPPGSARNTDVSRMRRTCEDNAQYAELANRSRTAQAWRLFGTQVVQNVEALLARSSSDEEKPVKKQLTTSSFSDDRANVNISEASDLRKSHDTTLVRTTSEAEPHGVNHLTPDQLPRQQSKNEPDDRLPAPAAPSQAQTNSILKQELLSKDGTVADNRNIPISQVADSGRKGVPEPSQQDSPIPRNADKGPTRSQSKAVPIPTQKQRASESFEIFPCSHDSQSSLNGALPRAGNAFKRVDHSFGSSEVSSAYNSVSSVKPSTATDQSSIAELFSSSANSETTSPLKKHPADVHAKAAATSNNEKTNIARDENTNEESRDVYATRYYTAPDLRPSVASSVQQNESSLSFRDSAQDKQRDESDTVLDSLSSLIHSLQLNSDSQMASHMVLLALQHALGLVASSPCINTLKLEHETYAVYVAEALDLSYEEASKLLAPHLNLLPSSLPPTFIEAVLSDYHTHLQSLGLDTASATLRRQSYPAYPAVYASAINDIDVALLCTECRNPINGIGTSTICETCRSLPASCTICHSVTSPYPLPPKKLPKKPKLDGSASKAKPQPQPSPSDDSTTQAKSTPEPSPTHLHTTCSLCNHTFHLTCAYAWFLPTNPKDPSSTPSGGACPTPGCVCDCTQGSYREERLATAEASEARRSTKQWPRVSPRTTLAPDSANTAPPDHHKTTSSVKPDKWHVSPSQAVKRVAGQLHVPLRDRNRDRNVYKAQDSTSIRDRGSVSDNQDNRPRRTTASASFPPTVRSKSSQESKDGRGRGSRSPRGVG